MKKLTTPAKVALGAAGICLCLGVVIGIRWVMFQRENAPIAAENARLEDELAQAKEETDSRADELTQLTAQAGDLRRQADALRTELSEYQPFLAEGESRQAYIENQMTALLERRLGLVETVRNEMSAGLNQFFSSFASGEYIPPELIDIPWEILKDTVSAITGEIGSPVSGVVGDAVNAAIDSSGDDLWDSVSSAAVESIGSAITQKVQDTVTDALGVSDVVSGVSTAQDLVDKVKDLFDTTPDYALAVTLDRAATYAQKVTAILDDPTSDVEELEQAVSDYNIFYGYSMAAFDLRDEAGLNTFWEPMLYSELAQAKELDRALGIYALLLREEGEK